MNIPFSTLEMELKRSCMRFHWSLMFLLFAILVASVRSESLLEEQYRFLIPDGYNRYEPPWSTNNPANIFLKLNVMDVDRVDDGKMEFNIQTYILEFWKDQRLNLSDFTNEDSTDKLFPSYLAKAIWVPTIIFENSKDGMIFPLSVPNTVLRVRPDGMFQKSTRYNLLVGCHMNFQFYPMDTQYCNIKIGNLGTPDKKVILRWTEEYDKELTNINLKADIQPLKYVLMKPQTHTTTQSWTTGNYTYLYANFTFVRRLSGTIFNVYIPSLLVVFLSWISFWIEITAVPARITLGVTSLLTLATQIVQAKSNLPTISYLTAVDIWLLACLLTVFSSLIEFAFAYQLFLLSKKKAENDLFCNVNLAMQDAKLSKTTQRQPSLQPRPPLRSSSSSKQGTALSGLVLDNICRKLFPFVFGAFSAIYWIYFLSNR